MVGECMQEGDYLDFTDEVVYWDVMDRWPTLVALRDPFTDKIVRCNNAYAGAIHLTRQDVEGKELHHLFGQEAAARYAQQDLQVLQSGIAKVSFLESIPVQGYKDKQVLAHKQVVLYKGQPAILVHAELVPDRLVTSDQHRKLQHLVYGLLGLQSGQVIFGHVTLDAVWGWLTWMAAHVKLGG